MARRKKRGPARESGKDGGDADQLKKSQQVRPAIPPARPPKKNLSLLFACAALFGIWLILLVLLAWTS